MNQLQSYKIFPYYHPKQTQNNAELGGNRIIFDRFPPGLLPLFFFIHGEKDTYVPTEMVYRLYDAKPTPKQLWTLPNTGHADSYINFPEEYTKKVKEFVSE